MEYFKLLLGFMIFLVFTCFTILTFCIRQTLGTSVRLCSDVESTAAAEVNQHLQKFIIPSIGKVHAHTS